MGGCLHSFAVRMVFRLCCSFLVLSAVACGGSRASVQSRKASRSQVLTLRGVGALKYAQPGTGAVVRGSTGAAQVERGVLRAAQAQSVELRGDSVLANVCESLLHLMKVGADVSDRQLVDFVARHHGLVEPAPLVVSLGQPDLHNLSDGVSASLGQAVTQKDFTHFGAAVSKDGDFFLVVIALSQRALRVEPFPRHVASAGASVQLQGNLLGDFVNPALLVQSPTAESQRLTSDDELEFDFRPKLPTRGVYRLELIAEGVRGTRILLNVPIFVGLKSPTQIERAEFRRSRTDSDSRSVASKLFDLINEVRAQRGIPSLALNDILQRVALNHTKDMAKGGYLGHRSTSTGLAADRVSAAGVQTGLVLENIAKGSSAETIHRDLMESPAHRANITNPDITHVGLGVQRRSGSFVVTQVFVRMNRKVDVQAAENRLHQLINSTRQSRDAGALTHDKHLRSAAQWAAEEFFRDDTVEQDEVVNLATRRLRRFALKYKKVAGLVAVVNRVEEAANFEPTLDPEVTMIGVGVTQGTRRDTVANAVVVVIMFAWPR